MLSGDYDVGAVVFVRGTFQFLVMFWHLMPHIERLSTLSMLVMFYGINHHTIFATVIVRDEIEETYVWSLAITGYTLTQ